MYIKLHKLNVKDVIDYQFEITIVIDKNQNYNLVLFKEDIEKNNKENYKSNYFPVYSEIYLDLYYISDPNESEKYIENYLRINNYSKIHSAKYYRIHKFEDIFNAKDLNNDIPEIKDDFEYKEGECGYFIDIDIIKNYTNLDIYIGNNKNHIFKLPSYGISTPSSCNKKKLIIYKNIGVFSLKFNKDINEYTLHSLDGYIDYIQEMKQYNELVASIGYNKIIYENELKNNKLFYIPLCNYMVCTDYNKLKSGIDRYDINKDKINIINEDIDKVSVQKSIVKRISKYIIQDNILIINDIDESLINEIRRVYAYINNYITEIHILHDNQIPSGVYYIHKKSEGNIFNNNISNNVYNSFSIKYFNINNIKSKLIENSVLCLCNENNNVIILGLNKNSILEFVKNNSICSYKSFDNDNVIINIPNITELEKNNKKLSEKIESLREIIQNLKEKNKNIIDEKIKMKKDYEYDIKQLKEELNILRKNNSCNRELEIENIKYKTLLNKLSIEEKKSKTSIIIESLKTFTSIVGFIGVTFQFIKFLINWYDNNSTSSSS